MLHGIVLFVSGVPALLLRFRLRKATDGVGRARLEFVFGMYLLLLVSVVLFPLRVDPGLRADEAVWDYATFVENWVNLTPFASIGQMLERPSRMQAVRQIGGNMLLLAPMGVLLPMMIRRMRRPLGVLVAITASAVGIEAAQYLARIARLSLRSIDVDDVILNVAGGLAGYVCWTLGCFILRMWRGGEPNSAAMAHEVIRR